MLLVQEKRLLQIAIIVGSCVPVMAGGMGMLMGVGMLGPGCIDLDSHFRYLSGLLLGIGIGFLTTVPRIEVHAPRFQVLTGIVVIGGFGRLLGVFMMGLPGASMIFALCMELLITPMLYLWQRSLSRRVARANSFLTTQATTY